MTAMRWSLASMFIATALVAVAAWVGKLGFDDFSDGGHRHALLLLAVPIVLGAAVGTLAGRVGLGIRFGVAITGGLIVVFSLWGIVHN
jgi:hypothetical protein